MLTLKELKKIVKVADVEKRIPSVKSLKEHKVVVKEMINAELASGHLPPIRYSLRQGQSLLL